MTTRLVNLLLILFAFAACSDEAGVEETGQRTNGYTQDSKNRQDSLFNDVMEGHDVGMAKMGKLVGARKSIGLRIDSLAKITSPTNKKSTADLLTLAESLQAAENGMNEWMENFKVDSATDNEPVRIAYLESERSKVNKVRDSILFTLKRADSVLSQAPNP